MLILVYLLKNLVISHCLERVKKGDITKVTIRQGGDNAWRIESISITATTCKGTIPITFDGMLNQWIGGDKPESLLLTDLTLYKPTLV